MKDANIPVIIQATNKSISMNAKVLAPILDGNTILAYLVKRLKPFWSGPVLLATTNQSHDDSLEAEACRLGVHVFRGEQDNVVKRLYDAASDLRCQNFVRVFGNYPFTDLSSMESLVGEHLSRGVHYSYNGHREGVLWGLECEVLNISCLHQLMGMNLSQKQLETATFFVRQNPDVFQQFKMNSSLLRPSYKVALETPKDLVLLQDIARHVGTPSLDSIVAYLDEHPILAGSNYETPTKEIGLEKLLLHPNKLESMLREDTCLDASYPVSVELSLTNRCNLKCVYCSDGKLRERQGRRDSLDKAALFALFDDLKAGGTKGIVIEGGGEPTLHPDFEELVEYLTKIELAAGLITNGTKKIRPDVLRKLEWIRVSLDASTIGEYKALKGVDCFEEVLAHIHYYAQYCPTVGIGYVVTNQNISQLEALILRLREYGVSYVQLRPVVDSPELYPYGEDLTYLNFYQTANYAIVTDGMRENAGSGNNKLPCWAHGLTTVITADGGVYLCGRLNIYDWVRPLGNICEQDFCEIWKSDERQRQSLQVLNSEFCEQHCPQCRISKFNQLRHRIKQIRTPHFI